MRVTLAPDSFKGSLTALEVCEAAARGISAVDQAIECVIVPMADGGEGTVQSLVDATRGRFATVSVQGPLWECVEARYGLLGDGHTAVIEMAAASGLTLVSEGQRNPLHTTTHGTGELIKAALDAGVSEFIVGLGGSATNDAGIGMAAALGARFLDDCGRELQPVGSSLSRLSAIDMSHFDDRVARAHIRVACDVSNPLFGPEGAAYVYGPQKGATPAVVAELDEGLQKFARIVERDLHISVAAVPGAGAAGGLGGGLIAFCGASLEPGVRIVVEAVGLREKMAGASLCITGEGRLDHQTVYGKTPKGVADVAAELGVPCVALGGAVMVNAGLNDTFEAVFSICPGPLSVAEAMQPDRAAELVAFTAGQIVRCFNAGRHNAATGG
jgi:glycerate 2-kinase